MTDIVKDAAPVVAPAPDKGGPDKEEVKRITDTIIEACGPCDLESALTAICNLAGQIVAALADGSPAEAERHGNSVSIHIRKVAIAKMLYDDQKQREALTLEEGKGDADDA